MKPRAARRVLVALVGVVAVLQGCVMLGGRPLTAPGPVVDGRTPVVFVPGVTGTELREPASGDLVWGGAKALFWPRDGGYRIVLPLPGTPDQAQSHYEATGPLLRIRLKVWTKKIYQPLLERFVAAGFRRGDLQAPGPLDDFFFFNYDWRHGNLEAVRRLDRQLEALAATRGGAEVDLVCQSNAAKICRWLIKYGGLDADEAEAGRKWRRGYRIRKLVLAGVSNQGALRVLQLLNTGRSYVPGVGRRFQPETFFSLRPLFEDLPAARDDLFFDRQGKTLPVDLFEAGNWAEYGWSIFGEAATQRLRRDPRPDLFGDRRLQLDYLQEQLSQARRLQRLLSTDSPRFPPVRYYLLENASSPTMARALLTRQDGRWRTYFLGDREVDGDPALRALAAAPGDGHAVVASQRGLSAQETAALVATASVVGPHFDAIVRPAALDELIGFLADPVEERGEPPPG